ncbi:MAG: hypothetical protein Q8933_19630 [Bacteroidota bacterium]|nr:hypothetical protein [Bacteroidota bacterium]
MDGKNRRLKVGAFQFAATGNIEDNLAEMVSFADIGSPENNKLNVIKSHLISRAAENAMYILSANSTSKNQLAPTCLIDPDGKVIDSALLNEESLLSAEIEMTIPNFGREGRIVHSKVLTKVDIL